MDALAPVEAGTVEVRRPPVSEQAEGYSPVLARLQGPSAMDCSAEKGQTLDQGYFGSG